VAKLKEKLSLKERLRRAYINESPAMQNLDDYLKKGNDIYIKKSLEKQREAYIKESRRRHEEVLNNAIQKLNDPLVSPPTKKES
jgi:hypothetical protein